MKLRIPAETVNELFDPKLDVALSDFTQRVLSEGWTYGAQARIAEELGVSHATISRDLKAIFPGAIECPVCACRHPLERWRELERQGRVKIGPGPSDDAGPPPGRDEDGDVDGDEQRPVDLPRGPESRDDDLRRFMELTNEMAEQNAAGVIDVGTVVPTSAD